MTAKSERNASIHLRILISIALVALAVVLAWKLVGIVAAVLFAFGLGSVIGAAYGDYYARRDA